MNLRLPEGVRCAIALTYDTDMAGGYAPDGICHGRTMPPLQAYILRLCETAESFAVKLHFFHIANGLEEPDISYLRSILERGHIIDSHTYSHIQLTTDDLDALDRDLALATRLFEERLSVKSVGLRGPGGYIHEDSMGFLRIRECSSRTASNA